MERIHPADPSVVVGPALGEDAAVLDLGGPELLVAKTDPITFVASGAARYLLAVNSNDLAVTGAEPRWLLVTAMLPEGVSQGEAESLFEELREACEQAGISLVGGHTEVTVGLERPILVGCLLGTVQRERLVRSSGARPGDALILAGGIAIEGTAILAREHAGELRRRGVPEALIAAAADWIDRPGIGVRTAARLLLDGGGVTAMHDPTEGGLATALHELAEAANIGLRVRREAIAVLPECRAICDALGLDPLGLLASGALLAAVEPGAAAAAVERLQAAGIPASVIGEARPASEGRLLASEQGIAALPVFARDELARYLENRMSA
ncbi:MAG: AIR synthase-related protein [Bryobacterales bacterium]|nr:AIR synthase-related protein [Bryobacterales bacterium]